MTLVYPKINEEKVRNLHSIGFKLIPILQDGFTPAIAWTKIYEYGWNEAELFRTQFPNIATCFGKTHLKDKDNTDLYLNCLDIDSEEVYNRLALLTDKNGRDLYFISQLRNHTYVTQTRKKYGRHIYWLSHNPNKAIHKQDCKYGYEFEIKTDKSGLAALPTSSHRDDKEFHYHNIGQNKIMINDDLYDEIIRILDDCLKKKSRYKKQEYVALESRQLGDADIDTICELISPVYQKGFRHLICYSISGLLHKNGVGLDSVSKIIYNIARDDEHLKSRLGVMRHTYLKDRSEVSGRIQLLETLEAAFNDKFVAGDVLRTILKILNQRSSEGIRDVDHNSIAEELIREFNFKSTSDTEEIYYYDCEQGTCRQYGEILIKQQLELLFPDITTHHVAEILHKIRRKNPVDRTEFDSDPFTVNVRNGLLNPITCELSSHSSKFLSLAQLPLVYDPKAKCPKILRFLAQVLRPCDIFTFMQFVGYCLIKSSKYEKALIFVGKGDNGKTVLLKLVEAFLGAENLSHVSLKELSEDKYSKAELFGKIANICGDLESQKIPDTSAFKQIVSGDSIRAQRKYQNPFYFRNYAKLIFSSNHIPKVANVGYPWYKRVIPFALLETFLDNKDVNKIDELITAEELSGFLNLVLIALKQLIKDGNFVHIEDIREIEKLFEDLEKGVSGFVSERCVRDAWSFEICVDIYRDYCQFCKQKGLQPLSDNSFGVILHEMGIQKLRPMTAGVRKYKYKGIKLKTRKIA